MALADKLREARKKKELSLRDVEREIDISNGYLSQLESGRVKQPSPVHLHWLAQLYEVSYSDLMREAGYVAPSAEGTPTGMAFSGSEDLTSQERKIVQDMIDALRSKRRE